MVSAKTTKPCSQCKEEKPYSEFHRRNTGLQNICKVCRSANSKLPGKKRKQMDNSANFEAIAARILENESKIRSIAARYANDLDTADEIYSFICERMLKYAKPEMSKIRFLNIAHFSAKRYIEIERTYQFYVVSKDTDGGDGKDIFEKPEARTFMVGGKSAECSTIENEEREAIAAAIAGLSPENRTIVSMLEDGKTQAEISRELGVTRASINQRVSKIAEQLRTFFGGQIPAFG